MAGMPDYYVAEQDYSWGTIVELFRKGRRVMFVDVYNDDTYAVYAESEW